MKKRWLIILLLFIILLAGGVFCYFTFFKASPWQDTWWGVQEAGRNWTGDDIRNLETFTFTPNDDNTITVKQRVQQGTQEVNGSLSGTGTVDGGRLTVTLSNGKEEVFTYNHMNDTIELPIQNVDKSPVELKRLTPDNNEEMEQIRSEIMKVASKPENAIDTTVSSSKT